MPIHTSDGQEFPNEYDFMRNELYQQGKNKLVMEHELRNIGVRNQLDSIRPNQSYNDGPTDAAYAREGDLIFELKAAQKEFDYRNLNPDVAIDSEVGKIPAGRDYAYDYKYGPAGKSERPDMNL